jgi:hypothetical protein
MFMLSIAGATLAMMSRLSLDLSRRASFFLKVTMTGLRPARDAGR